MEVGQINHLLLANFTKGMFPPLLALLRRGPFRGSPAYGSFDACFCRPQPQPSRRGRFLRFLLCSIAPERLVGRWTRDPAWGSRSTTGRDTTPRNKARCKVRTWLPSGHAVFPIHYTPTLRLLALTRWTLGLESQTQRGDPPRQTSPASGVIGQNQAIHRRTT